jgi:hypothetical protein
MLLSGKNDGCNGVGVGAVRERARETILGGEVGGWPEERRARRRQVLGILEGKKGLLLR